MTNLTASTKIIPMVNAHGEEDEHTKGYYAIETTVYLDDQEKGKVYAKWLTARDAKIMKNQHERQVLESERKKLNTITPHKGGRDKWLSARVTESERERIKAVLNKAGLSLADWIMAKVAEEEVEAD